jgi:pilus assembly protein CpaF
MSGHPGSGRLAGADLVEPVRTRIAGRGEGASGVDLARHVRDAALAAGQVLGVGDLHAAVDDLREHAWGLGPLRDLLDDPEVTDILVNGRDGVWVDRGAGLEPAAVSTGGEAQVRAMAVRLAAGAGRRLDDGRPWVDARLPGGVRLHAVVPPVAPAGTHVSLRVLRPTRFPLSALEASGSVPPGWGDVLAALVHRRAAFLVTGGTGAGKTTLLAALLSLVPPRERIVLVEDVGELAPQHPHVVNLEARHANLEGSGEVSLADLVRQALRMRPDRLVVGECRGAEVRELLAALNTGHEGGCGTLHANAASEVPARLEALGALAGMDPVAVATQAVAALDAIVHVRRSAGAGRAGARQVVEVALLERGLDRRLEVTPALVASDDPGADGASVPGRRGPGWAALARRLGLPEGVAAPGGGAGRP